VVFERRSKRIVHGDNADKVTQKRIRAHANASEQIPISLILIGANEYLMGGAILIWVMAAMLIIGRVLHAYYFAVNGSHHNLRVVGMSLTLLSQIIAVIALFAQLIIG
jgi:uncharacterized membrane protein YecN with MAPEG domain